MQEEWKDISIDRRYKISNLGRIYSAISGKILKTQSRNRYESCSIAGNRQSVHRLVALAFLPNPKGFATVNHKNGNKHDNRAANLEWCSQKQNIRHAWDTGLATTKVGQHKHTSILNDINILVIATMHKTHKNKLLNYLPSRQGTKPSIKSKREQIRRIVKGERWAHLNHLFNL